MIKFLTYILHSGSTYLIFGVILGGIEPQFYSSLIGQGRKNDNIMAIALSIVGIVINITLRLWIRIIQWKLPLNTQIAQVKILQLLRTIA